MRRIPTNLVHAQVLGPFERCLREGGAPVARLFASSEINLAAVSDDRALITMLQAHHFCEAAARYTGEVALGSIVGEALELDELGATTHAFSQSATLFDARFAIQSAVQAAEPGSQLWIEQGDSLAWLCYRPESRFFGGTQSELFDLQCLLKFVRLAGGDGWTPDRIRVSTNSERALAKVPDFSNSDLRRGSGHTAIAFPKHLLSRPLPNRAGTELSTPDWPQHSDSPLRVDGELGVDAAVGGLLDSLQASEPIPSLEAMAERFGVSSRTLQRALADCQTSYRLLTEKVTFRRAVPLLEDERLPVKSIAGVLGYGSSNSFIRAFRRIAGTTPTEYRKSHRLP